jgi:hypothetical protein
MTASPFDLLEPSDVEPASVARRTPPTHSTTNTDTPMRPSHGVLRASDGLLAVMG